jgi:hypothetical protein
MTRSILSIVTICVATSVASAQNPIVAIKVTPEKSVFEGSMWNKPIVVKSKDDAAKHFGKDELATLEKEVDFKKQFVLIFAWRGSGGDKLSYTVAESFPEQIFFSLKPGVTDDLRSHTHVYALRSNVKWSAGKGPKKEIDEKPAVRPVKFVAKDPTVAFMIGGMSKVTTLADAEAVEKLVGKDSAKSLIDAVDFKKETLVLVSWTTSGPPDGMLNHEIKGDGADRKVTFYVQGPAGAKVRGQRARIGADFFAVPRDLKVAFESKER